MLCTDHVNAKPPVFFDGDESPRTRRSSRRDSRQCRCCCRWGGLQEFSTHEVSAKPPGRQNNGMRSSSRRRCPSTSFLVEARYGHGDRQGRRLCQRRRRDVSPRWLRRQADVLHSASWRQQTHRLRLRRVRTPLPHPSPLLLLPATLPTSAFHRCRTPCADE